MIPLISLKKCFALCLLLLPTLLRAGALEDMEEAMIRKDAATVMAFVERGMDVNTVDQKGDSLLIQAIRQDIPELVDQLIARRARLNVRNRNGETALSIAAFVGKLPYVQRLVEAGAEVNFYGWPPLTYAAFNGHQEIVAYLLKHEAEINARTANGSTALFFAARNGHTAVVHLLLEQGADPMIANQNDETPVDVAQKGKHSDSVDLLRAAGGRSGKSVVLDLSK